MPRGGASAPHPVERGVETRGGSVLRVLESARGRCETRVRMTAWLLRGGQTCREQEAGGSLGDRQPREAPRPGLSAQMRGEAGSWWQDMRQLGLLGKIRVQGGKGAGVWGDGTGFESWLPHVQAARPDTVASGLRACLLVCNIPVRTEAKSTRSSSPTPLPTRRGPGARLAAAPAPRASPTFHALQSGPPPAGPAAQRSHTCESHFEGWAARAQGWLLESHVLEAGGWQGQCGGAVMVCADAQRRQE